jgi:hypothetical protein
LPPVDPDWKKLHRDLHNDFQDGPFFPTIAELLRVLVGALFQNRAICSGLHLGASGGKWLFFLVLGCSVPPGAPPCCNVFATVPQARAESQWLRLLVLVEVFYFFRRQGPVVDADVVEVSRPLSDKHWPTINGAFFSLMLSFTIRLLW